MKKLLMLLCAVMISAVVYSQTNFYSKPIGDLNDPTTWGDDPDQSGGGTNPANFTTNTYRFHVYNRATATIGANWVLTGTNVRINVGDGITPCELIIPAAFSISGTGGRINVAAGSTLTIQNSTNPIMSTLNVASTVNYDMSGAQTIAAGNYGILNILQDRGGANVTFSGAVGIAGTFTLPTGVGSYITTGSTISYNKTGGGQVIYSQIPYNNLSSGLTSGINTTDGDLNVAATLTVASGTTLDMGTDDLQTATTLTFGSATSTLSTQSLSANAIPSGMAITGTGIVNYNAATGAQTIVPLTAYARLTLGNTSGSNVPGGNLVVNTALITTVGGTIDMGNNTISGTLATITNNGTILTQNTSSTPFAAGKTWGGTGTLEYNHTGAQTVVAGTYNCALTVSGARGGGDITFGTGIVSVGGLFSLTATGVGSYVTTGNTFNYSTAAGGRTIYSIIPYNNLTSGNGSGTNTADGNLSVAGTLLTTSGGTLNLSTFDLSGTPAIITNNGTIRTSSLSNPALPAGVSWTGTTGGVTFASLTGDQSIPLGDYKTLTCLNTSGTNTVVGTGALNLTGVLTTSAAGGTLDMGENTLVSSSTITNTGRIKTQNTSSLPLPTGKTWAGTVEYNSGGNQTMVAGTFASLALSGDHSAGVVTLESGAITASGNFSVTATNIGSYITTGNTFTYSGVAAAVGGIRYNNLTFSSGAAGTRTAGGDITVDGTLTTTSGTGIFSMSTFALIDGGAMSVNNAGRISTLCTVNPAIPSGKNWEGTSGIVTFAALTGGQFVPAGTYKTLTLSNTSGTNTVTGNLNLTGVLTTSAAGGTLDMGTNTLVSSSTITNTGSILTQNLSSLPLPSGKTWLGTVNYNAATGAQTVVTGGYTTLTLGNTTGTSTAEGALSVATALNIPNSGATLDMSTFAMSGAHTVANNGTITTANMSGAPFAGGKTWGGTGTVIYNVAGGGQTVMAGTYTNNLTLLNTSGTDTVTGPITANATLTTTSGGTLAFSQPTYSLAGTVVPANSGTIQTICTVAAAIPASKSWGGTIVYTRTNGGQTIPAGTFNNLTFSNASGTVTASGVLTVNGALTTTSGGTLAMVLNQLAGSLPTLTNDGTITTTCTANPAIPSGKDWSGTTGQVTFAALTGNQKIPAGTYKTLVCSNTSLINTAQGDIEVTTALTTSAAGGTLDMGTNLLTGAFSATNTGTLRTQNTSGNPITSGKTWAGTVNYNATTGGQTISEGTYATLTNGNTSGTNTAGGDLSVGTALTIANAADIMDMSTHALSGAFTVPALGTIKTANMSATPVPSGKTWNAATTVNYNAATGAQTIAAGTYGTLTLDNTSGTTAAGGNVSVATALNVTNAAATMDMSTFTLLGGLTTITNNGTITTGNMSTTPFTTGKTWGGSGTVVYNVAGGGQTVMAGTYNNNLTVLNTTGINTVSGTVTANATLTTTAGGALEFAAVSHQLLGATINPVNNGTIQTICTVVPAIPASKTWAGTIIYTRLTGGQTIPAGTYNNLTFNNTSATNTATGVLTVNGALTTTTGGTLAMVLNQLAGSPTVTNNGTITTTSIANPAIPSGKDWTGTTGTVSFAALTGNQFIPAGTFKNLTCLNTSNTNTAGGDIDVSTGLTTSAAGGTMDMGANLLTGTFAPTNTGTLRTQNTSSTPIPSSKTWGGTVIYNATTGGQRISAAQFATLRLENTSGITTVDSALTVTTALVNANAGATLDMSTFALAGAHTVSNSGTITTANMSAAPFVGGKSWTGTGTVVYNVTGGGQTVMAGTYANNLTVLNSTGSNTASGSITANATLTTTAGGVLDFAAQNHQLLGATMVPVNNGTIQTVCTVTPSAIPTGKTWGGTIIYAKANGAQTIPTGTFNNLVFNNTSGTVTASGALQIDGALTTSTGGILAMVLNQMTGALTTVTNNGTITTTSIANPAIPAGKDWTGTTGQVTYAATTGNQFVAAGTYKTLVCSNTSNTNTVTGDIDVSTGLTTSAAGGTLDMGTNLLTGTFVPTNTGTIKTQNTSSSSITSGKTWIGIVDYNGTGAQTLVTGTFTNLSLSGARSGSPAITLENGNINVSGNFSVTATGVGSYATGTNVFTYTTNANNSVGGIDYNDLIFTNTANTKTANGNVNVAGVLTTASGGTFAMSSFELGGTPSLVTHNGSLSTLSTSATPIPSGYTWTGTTGLVTFGNTTGGQSIPAGTYKTLTCANASGTNSAVATFSVAGTFIANGAAGTLDMGLFDFAATTVTNPAGGTIRTESVSSTPIPTGKAIGGTVNYNAANGGQTIVTETSYANLTLSNTSGTNTANGGIAVTGTLTTGAGTTIFEMGTNAISGTLTGIAGGGTIKTANATTTPLTVSKTWTQTIEFNRAAGGQTIVSGTYNGGLTNANTTGTNSLSATAVLTVTGTLTLNSGSVLADMTRNIVLNGNIAGTGTHTNSASGRITMIGSGGSISGATLGDVTLDNAGGFTLTGSPQIDGTLTLTTGRLDIGNNNLTLGTTATAIAGTPSAANMIVSTGTGEVRKRYSGIGNFDFPIGDDGPNYTPISVNVTAGTPGVNAYVGVKVKNTAHPANTNTTNFLNRYWSVSTSDFTSPIYSQTATYVGGDVDGDENEIVTASYSGALPWVKHSVANVGLKTLTATGITATSSDFTGIANIVPTVTVTPPTVTICSGGSVDLEAIGLGDPTLTYSWSPSTGLSATTGAIVTASPTTGMTATTVVYTVTITDGNGFTSTGNSTVSVNPAPAAITGTANVCEGFATTLGSPESGGTWTSATPSIATIDLNTGEVSGIDNGTSIITYELAYQCFATKIVTVNIQPAANTGTAVVCDESQITLLNGLPGGEWSSGTPSVATVGSLTGTVTGVSDGTAPISYIMPTGCFVSTQVTVNPLPSIDGVADYCAGSTSVLTSDLPGGTWTSSVTAKATVGLNTGFVSAISTGTSNITYTAPTGCRRVLQVTVNGSIAAVIGTLGLCANSTTSLSHAVMGGTWISSNISAATVDINSGLVSGVAPGTSIITYTAAPGCYKLATVTVIALPANITGTAVVCEGSNTTLANVSGGGTWTSGDLTKATVFYSSGAVTGVSAGTALITYNWYNTCKVTREVTVNPRPDVITGTTTICAGSTSDLLDATALGTWSSSHAFVATVGSSTGTVTALLGGTTTITYTLPTTCRRTTQVSVSVRPTPITGVLSICPAGTTALSASTGHTWTSEFPLIASVSGTGIVTGASAGTTTITYANTNGCLRTTVITVNSLPAAISGSSTVCIGLTAPYSTVSVGGSWSSSNYTKLSMNSSTGVATALTAGNANVTYTMAGPGCYVVKQVTVNATMATITGTTTVCTGASTTLSHGTPGGAWSSSDAGVATIDAGTGLVAAISPGTITITYTLSAGCYKTVALTVKALPGAITGVTTVCQGTTTALGCSPAGGVWTSSTPAQAIIGSATGIVTGVTAGMPSVTYTTPGVGCYNTTQLTVNAALAAITGTTNVCVGNVTTLVHGEAGGTWSSSNPARATVDAGTGAVSGIGAGTVTITYTVTNGCYQKTTVTVNPLPAAITGTASVCEGLTTVLGAITGGGTWSSSMPSVATINPATRVVTGVSFGNTTITYQLPTGCYNTREITVNALPASITGTLATCIGGTTSLNSVTGGGTWMSSNLVATSIGSSSGIVTGLALGTATISYTMPTGCRKTTIVTVSSVPASITGALIVCEGNTSPLSSTTVGGTWSTSDAGVASISVGGMVTGESAGTATISYIYSPDCYKTAVVTVNAALPSNTGTDIVCVGQTVGLSNAEIGGTWSSSNTAKATVVVGTGVVTGMSAGTANISYKVGAGGCFSVTQVTVNAALATITGTTAVCVGATTTLMHSEPGGTWSSSNAARGTVNASGEVTGISAGTINITYTVSPGCYKLVTVHVLPLPGPITGPASVCEASTTTLANYSGGGTWTSGNTGIASVYYSSGMVTGVSEGTVRITYNWYNSCNITQVVTVNPRPAVITGTTNVCVGGNVLLESATGGGTWTSSLTSVATIGSSSGVVTGVLGGLSNISYTLSTGCRRITTVTVGNVTSAISGTLVLCNGSTSALAATPTSYTWSSDNAPVATVSGSGVVTAVSTGTATISYTHSSGCPRTAIVTVNAALTANTGLDNVCPGQSITLLNATGGGTWSSSNTAKAIAYDGTGVVAGVSAGTAMITYQTTPGCRSMTQITVNALPASITGTNTAPIAGSSTLYNVTPGGTWSSSNTGRATVGSMSGSVTGVSTGTATITYTAPVTGCFITRLFTVTASKPGQQTTDEVAEGNTAIVLFPNPTSGTLSVSTPSTGVLTIYTLDGKLIQDYTITRSPFVVSLPYNLAAGVYVCQFKGDDGSSNIVRVVYEP